jgi:hypothetical protein
VPEGTARLDALRRILRPGTAPTNANGR